MGDGCWRGMRIRRRRRITLWGGEGGIRLFVCANGAFVFQGFVRGISLCCLRFPFCGAKAFVVIRLQDCA